jgi:hypothetical protein
MALIPKGTATVNQKGDIITYTDITSVYNGSTNPTGYGTPNRGNANHITDFVITKPDGSVVTIRNNEALTNPTQAALPVLVPANALSKTFTPANLGYSTSTLKFPDGIYKMECWMWYRITGVGEVSSASSAYLSGANFNSITVGFGDTSWVKIIDQQLKESNRYATIVDGENITVSEPWGSDFTVSESISIYAGYVTTIYIKVINGLLSCIQPKMAKISMTEKSCCKLCGSSDIDKAMEVFFGVFSVDSQFKVGLYEEANNNIIALNKLCASEDCKC